MKRKRASRAKNKIQGSLEGALIKADPDGQADVPRVILQSTSKAVPRSTLFASELEQVIDIIARERVYRAYLASLGRRLLAAPTTHNLNDASQSPSPSGRGPG